MYKLVPENIEQCGQGSYREQDEDEFVRCMWFGEKEKAWYELPLAGKYMEEERERGIPKEKWLRPMKRQEGNVGMTWTHWHKISLDGVISQRSYISPWVLQELFDIWFTDQGGMIQFYNTLRVEIQDITYYFNFIFNSNVQLESCRLNTE